MGLQDLSQNVKDYSKEEADAIFGVVGNIISGQVTGDTAKHLSEQFGKILQEKVSQNINSSDTSFTKSTQLEYAIPASKISRLSSGEFVGVVADNPDCKIDLKMFHAEIQNDFQAISEEESKYREIPIINAITPEDVRYNYERLKDEVREIVRTELKKLEGNKPIEPPQSDAPRENAGSPISM